MLQEKPTPQIKYRFASLEEAKKLYLANTEYFAQFSEADLSYKLQKKNGTIEELKSFGVTQMLEMTDSDKQILTSQINKMETILSQNKIKLPFPEPAPEIIFIKSTQDEECGSAAYTHHNQIYLGQCVFDALVSTKERFKKFGETVLWHELFHCLTRANNQFRKDMYKIIHFTVCDHDFPIPENVKRISITNPDVGHHDSYASFLINGKPINCFLVFVTKPFENEGDSFFQRSTEYLLPINPNEPNEVDNDLNFYLPQDASNFWEIFGRNTEYVIDPEETMADNFADAMAYGLKGKDYANPEIIRQIIEYLTKA